MPRTNIPGTCLLCRQEFNKASMGRHLAKCAAENESDRAGNKKYKKRTLYLLQVQGKYNPAYWLYLEVQSKTEFADVDDFLRAIWLECCGHLSAFRFVKKKNAKRDPAPLDLFMSGQLNPAAMDEFFKDPNEIDMDQEIGSVWSPKTELEYEYDFGSTTPLKIKMVSERTGLVKAKEWVRLLARNHQPIIPCGSCGAPSTKIDTELVYSPAGWMCDICWEKHLDEDEEMYGMRVVNSPRVGVCGYIGSSKTDLGEPLPTFVHSSE